jgi:hypothetical protein
VAVCPIGWFSEAGENGGLPADGEPAAPRSSELVMGFIMRLSSQARLVAGTLTKVAPRLTPFSSTGRC